MTTIAAPSGAFHIPPAALEAGARAIFRSSFGPDFDWDEQTDNIRSPIYAEARAALVAMVEAWPGMKACEEDDLGPACLILPLTEKQDDKA